MATLTQAEAKAILIAEVGETPGGLLAANFDALWGRYEDQAVLSPRLREMYVRRSLIQIALGSVRGAVDFVDGDHAQKASQAAATLLKMLAETQDEIALETEIAAGASGTAAIGELTTVAPQTPPTGPLVRPFGPKAEDPPYWPSPYYPERGRTVRRW